MYGACRDGAAGARRWFAWQRGLRRLRDIRPGGDRTGRDSPRRCIAGCSRCAAFEKRANDLFLQGLVKGTSHLGLRPGGDRGGFRPGYACPATTPLPPDRGHNHTLARGVPMMPVMAELMGRAGGPNGRQGRLDAPDERRSTE